MVGIRHALLSGEQSQTVVPICTAIRNWAYGGNSTFGTAKTVLCLYQEYIIMMLNPLPGSLLL